MNALYSFIFCLLQEMVGLLDESQKLHEVDFLEQKNPFWRGIQVYFNKSLFSSVKDTLNLHQ